MITPTDSYFSRKLALASWSCSCFSKLSDGVDAPQKPQIIDYINLMDPPPPPPPPPPRFDSPLRAVSGTTKQLQHTKHLQRPAQQRQQQQHQQQQQTTQRRQQQQHTQRRGSSSRSRPPSASSSSSCRRPGACRAQRSSAQRSSGSSSTSSSSTSSRPPEARLAFVHPLWPQVKYELKPPRKVLWSVRGLAAT